MGGRERRREGRREGWREGKTYLEAVVAVDAGDGVKMDGAERPPVELVLDRGLGG